MKQFVVGLTGPIGAGKSSVCALLKAMGLHCIDADFVSRQVAMPGSACLKELVDAFGAGILENGALNRKKLAAIAFSSESDQRRLGQITHPYITMEIVRQVEALPESTIVVIEATLLFGSPLEPICNMTVAVIADDTVRLERILQRDHADIASARARMRAQPSCEEYRRLAQFIIVNNGDQEQLQRQTSKLYQRLKEACE